MDYKRGNAASLQDRFADARSFLYKSLHTAEEIPSVQHEVRALSRPITVEYRNGNSDKAVEVANQAMALARQNGIEYWAADALIRRGNAYLMRLDLSHGQPDFEEALKLAKEYQRPHLQAMAEFSLASVYDQLESRMNRRCSPALL